MPPASLFLFITHSRNYYNCAKWDDEEESSRIVFISLVSLEAQKLLTYKVWQEEGTAMKKRCECVFVEVKKVSSSSIQKRKKKK